MRLGRLGLVGAAISFARSRQGQQLIRQARERLDTPQNRAKVRQTVESLRGHRPPH
jgi:hypothetical protein